MAITSSSNTSFIEAQQYSQFILENMHDGLLPGNFYRDVSDFGNGTTLNIKTIGEAQIQEVTEDTPIKYSPIETGNVTLTITDYVGDAWYITDVMRQDGSQIEQLKAVRGKEAVRAIQEHFETRFLATCNSAQTDANANSINGFAHRIASAETNDVISMNHLIQMRLAFDKAEVPQAGRIAIVDPVVEATLNTKFNITSATDALSANATNQMIFENGLDRDHKFIINLFGWDVMTSNRLPRGDFGDGTNSVTGAVANVFMCIADDQCKPIMAAWRQMPTVEGERNKDLGRDEYVNRARWGIGAQRVDTLGIVITSATNYV